MTPVAVVSCPVECMLDDRVWRRYAALARSRPGGFRIAALMRPPDGAEWRSSERWLERARAAEELGPVGLHTHFGGRESARPGANPPAPPADRVSDEAAWLSEHGLEPRFFCGGGWYMDADLAAVLAGLGLTDSTATRFRHGYLPPGAARLS